MYNNLRFYKDSEYNLNIETFVRIGPVNLYVGTGEGVQVGLCIRFPAGLGGKSALYRPGKQVPERRAVVFGPGVRLPAHARSRSGKQVPHPVFFVISVPGRYRCGVQHLLHLFPPQRYRGQDFRHLVQADKDALRGKMLIPVVIQRFAGAESCHKGAACARQPQSVLHAFISGLSAGSCCKVPDTYPC